MRRFFDLPATTLSWRALALASLAVVGCSSEHADASTDPVSPPPAVVRTDVVGSPLPIDQFQRLSIPTYDGSGEAVHPTYFGSPSSWPASLHYLFATPYPNGQSGLENPSLYAGLDGVKWDTLGGVRNPLVTSKGGYLSDPEAVYEPDEHQVYLYYREVTSSNIIKLIRSSDGRAWTDPVVVITAPNHQVVSPAVVRRSKGDWLMWSVNGGSGCSDDTTFVELRHSSNGIDWSAPEPVALSQPGVWPWHVDVKWIPSRREYWVLFNGKTKFNCTTRYLFMGTSSDGMVWQTYPSPLLAAGATPDLQDIVYKSSLVFDAPTKTVTFLYSGATYKAGKYVWSIVVQRRNVADVFLGLNGAPADLLTARYTSPKLIGPP